MKEVVMGTAGHVDHGKTELVKILTGIDTDRLQEEKKRGMTIELGFAPLDLQNGTRISIVDVPGHERFVKTMVSGATGIDFVMLVIAADEGIMPQTREHLDIISLLNIQLGIVVISKVDLVDQEWLRIVIEDIHEELQHTSLNQAPVIAVSSKTKEGITPLMKAIETISAQAREREAAGLFRMNVDRVFTISGHGTVVTGTISGRYIEKGNQIQILPSGKKVKIRGIQVHGAFVEKAFAGERCALNLMGVETAEVDRGNVILSPDVIRPTLRVDAVIETIAEIGDIRHNQRVHIHIGTQEVLGRVRIIGQDIIPAGEKGYVQIRFEKPIVGIRGDRFIIRSYSPVRTIAGGQILFHEVPNRPRHSERSLGIVELESKGSLKQLIQMLLNNQEHLQSLNDLWKILFGDRDIIKKQLSMLIQDGRAVYIETIDKYMGRQVFEHFIKRMKNEFRQLSKKYLFRFWIDKEEMKQKIFYKIEPREYGALLQYFIQRHLFILKDNWLMETDSKILRDIQQKREVRWVEKIYLKSGMSPKKLKQLSEEIGMDSTTLEEVIEFLAMSDVLVGLGEELWIHKTTFQKSMEQIREMFSKQEKITVGEVRDRLGAGRKNVILLLEYLDQMGVTIRRGNDRYPGICLNHRLS